MPDTTTGKASCTTSSLAAGALRAVAMEARSVVAVGSHTFTAVYSGNARYAPSLGTLALTVVKAPVSSSTELVVGATARTTSPEPPSSAPSVPVTATQGASLAYTGADVLEPVALDAVVLPPGGALLVIGRLGRRRRQPAAVNRPER